MDQKLGDQVDNLQILEKNNGNSHEIFDKALEQCLKFGMFNVSGVEIQDTEDSLSLLP
ncbi:hypothetical protein CCACVL1_16463 [Corchorus capsularis]|uniref:Uncharacterized protein n=1 Tax=Corchorus capsularis TaxID=210143 RepID=A0A1R3HWQ8_COCAP|nr:hypothetical protein CCACVL1_16463 [Corchorus capsularis]